MNDFPDRLRQIGAAHGFTVRWFDRLRSTNTEAAVGNYAHGEVIVTDRQTAGRGQRGNRWVSGEGSNLTFTVVLAPGRLPAEDQFYLSKIVSLAAVDALAHCGLPSTVKWPNDIYAGDSKVAGILIENDLLGPFISRSVVGIGLNVNQRRFDPSLPNPSSLALETGRDHDRAEVFGHFLRSLRLWADGLDGGEREAIDASYLSVLYRRQGDHLFRLPGGETFRARLLTVKPSGELVLRRADGTQSGYLFKEVEFVIG